MLSTRNPWTTPSVYCTVTGDWDSAAEGSIRTDVSRAASAENRISFVISHHTLPKVLKWQGASLSTMTGRGPEHLGVASGVARSLDMESATRTHLAQEASGIARQLSLPILIYFPEFDIVRCSH